MLTIDGFLECRIFPDQTNCMVYENNQVVCTVFKRKKYVGFTDIGQTPNLAE